MNKKLLSILTACAIIVAPSVVFAGDKATCSGHKAEASCSAEKKHPDCFKHGMSAEDSKKCTEKAEHAGKACSGNKTADAHTGSCKGEKSCGAEKKTTH